MAYDYNIYNAIKYFDTDTETVDVPFDRTISQEAIDYVEDTIYPEYKAAPTSSTLLYPVVRNNLERVLDSEKQLCVIVQRKDQISNLWSTVETFVVSTDQREINDTGTSMFIESVINEESKYVQVCLNPNDTTTMNSEADALMIATKGFVQLTGGKDGVWGRDDDNDPETALNGAVSEALDILYKSEELIDIGLIIESNKSETVKRKIIEICELRKDCLGILDVKKHMVVNNRGNEVKDLTR